MKAILKKTVGPNFRAGDIIVGENTRIKRLHDKGIVTLDHSLTAMLGNVFSTVISMLVVLLCIATLFPFIKNLTETWFGAALVMSWIWRITLIAVSLIVILINISHFLNARIPYVAYFLSFGTNIFGGFAIMCGHERTVSKYQPASVSITAAITLMSIGALMFGIAVWANVLYVIKVFDGDIIIGTINFSDTWQINLLWIAYILVMISGIVFAIYFDRDYANRRQRYIAFLKHKNATIEYKTKALHAYRSYKNTGNADKFLERNIELLEETLEVDRNQIEDPTKKNK